jgi:glycosyltransferase involved in cell wall biosynthesis
VRLPLRAVVDVIRGEGLASALRRTRERLTRAERFDDRDVEIINVCADITPRSGGVAIQLLHRLHDEHALRKMRVTTRLPSPDTAVHIESAHGFDFAEIVRFKKFVISVHDFTLIASREVLEAATGVIFPSEFLRDAYGVAGEIVEPCLPHVEIGTGGTNIAFAGNVKRHKGGHLLPEIARSLDVPFHVFGSGDVDLLRALRRVPNVVVHGYYRHGTLPSLLARYDIGRVVLPSIVPESYSLVLTECWQAGAAVAAFDIGAIAARIRRHGGGWLTPLESGAQGLVALLRLPNVAVPQVPRSNAAAQHVALYRKWGLLS